jgi:hypothetical protein
MAIGTNDIAFPDFAKDAFRDGARFVHQVSDLGSFLSGVAVMEVENSRVVVSAIDASLFGFDHGEPRIRCLPASRGMPSDVLYVSDPCAGYAPTSLWSAGHSRFAAALADVSERSSALVIVICQELTAALAPFPISLGMKTFPSAPLANERKRSGPWLAGIAPFPRLPATGPRH